MDNRTLSIEQKMKYFLPSILIVLFLDFTTKKLAEAFLGEPVALIPGVINLKLTYNEGMSFSWFEGFWWISVLISVVMIVGLAQGIVAQDIPKLWVIFAGILIGGIAGNLIDRIMNAEHAVIDFIQYFDWFIGNVADIAIVISMIFLGITGIFAWIAGQ